MNWFSEIFNKNKRDIEVLYAVGNVTGEYRIIKDFNNLMFPQKKINGDWCNILCTNDLGWYRVPEFEGYSNYRNAEINIEYALKYGGREANEYYK